MSSPSKAPLVGWNISNITDSPCKPLYPTLSTSDNETSESSIKHKRSSSSTRSSRSSSCSSSSDSDKKETSNAQKEARKEAKRIRNEQKRQNKREKKQYKKAKRLEKKQKKMERKAKKEADSIQLDESACGPPISLMNTKARAPQTKEDYDKQQSIIRRVVDPETGRTRLVKGDGEVLEEIVTRDRHKAINRQATQGDGEFFQSRTVGWAMDKV